jgi:hypothetical protein
MGVFVEVGVCIVVGVCVTVQGRVAADVAVMAGVNVGVEVLPLLVCSWNSVLPCGKYKRVCTPESKELKIYLFCYCRIKFNRY